LVEGQEASSCASQLSRHLYAVGVHGKVHDAPATQGQIGRVAVLAVLRDSVFGALAGE